MSATEAKVRCPKCHFRFFVPLAEVGRDGNTPCPNCSTSIHIKTRPEAGVPMPKAPPAAPAQPVAAPRGPAAPILPESAAAAPAVTSTNAAATPARPWWKFWAR